jgi:hypothetical protein
MSSRGPEAATHRSTPHDASPTRLASATGEKAAALKHGHDIPLPLVRQRAKSFYLRSQIAHIARRCEVVLLNHPEKILIANISGSP